MTTHTPTAPTDTRDAVERRRWRLGRRARHTVLAVHIAVSVGLLGDSAGFLAVAIRHTTSNDPAFIDTTREVLRMFALFFGIPLSFLALLTGLALGVGTHWGVLRYPWVITKLALILSVIVVGATVFRPLLFDTTTNDTALLTAATWDVLALATATALAVFKPGGPINGVRENLRPGGTNSETAPNTRSES